MGRQSGFPLHNGLPQQAFALENSSREPPVRPTGGAVGPSLLPPTAPNHPFKTSLSLLPSSLGPRSGETHFLLPLWPLLSQHLPLIIAFISPFASSGPTPMDISGVFLIGAE